jgi:hypothetical protein
MAASSSALALLPPGISPHALVIDPLDMAVADGSIYWSNSTGEIAAARVDGSGGRVIVPAALSGHPGGITVSGQSLIWSSFDGSPQVSIREANLDGSDPKVMFSEPDSSTPLDVRVVGERLYWLDRGDGQVLNRWPRPSIVQADPNGTNTRVLLADDPLFPPAPFEPRDLLFNAEAFTVAGNQFYWSSVGVGGPPSPSAAGGPFIAAANLDGSNPRVISPSFLRGVNTNIGDITSAANNLYWREDGRIVRSGLDGSGQVTLISGANVTGYPGQAIAVDTAHVYWGSGRTSIWEANLDGSDPHVLISDTSSPASRCVVPNLKGKTLAKAKKLLARAHCKLGMVYKSKGHTSHRLAVVSQKPGAKKTVAAGTKVSVRLRP